MLLVLLRLWYHLLLHLFNLVHLGLLLLLIFCTLLHFEYLLGRLFFGFFVTFFRSASSTIRLLSHNHHFLLGIPWSFFKDIVFYYLINLISLSSISLSSVSLGRVQVWHTDRLYIKFSFLFLFDHLLQKFLCTLLNDQLICDVFTI